jgi:hypothetical protein
MRRSRAFIICGFLVLACNGQTEDGSLTVRPGDARPTTNPDEVTPDDGSCAPGDRVPCDCSTHHGLRTCLLSGEYGQCVCAVAGAPGTTAECTIGSSCEGCGSCFDECVCRTLNPQACVEACADTCEGGYFADARSCDDCTMQLISSQLCFQDPFAACGCACGYPSMDCEFSVGCPTTVICRE